MFELIGLSKEELDQAKEDVLNTGQRRINRVKRSIEQLEEEIKQLKTEIESNRKEFDSIDATIDNLKSEIARNTEKVTSVRGKVDTLEQNINSQEEDIRVLREGLQDYVTVQEAQDIAEEKVSGVDTLELSEVFKCLHKIQQIRQSDNRKVSDNKDIVFKLSNNGLNQQEIATLLGTSRQTINRHLNK